MNKCYLCRRKNKICVDCDIKRKQKWIAEFLSTCKDAKTHEEYPRYMFGSNGKIFNTDNGKYSTIYFGNRSCAVTLKNADNKSVRVSANRLLYEVFFRKPLENEVIKPRDGNIENLSVDNLQLFKRLVGKTTTDQVVEIDKLDIDKSREYNADDINDQLLSDLGLRRKKGIIYYCQLDEGWFYKN